MTRLGAKKRREQRMKDSWVYQGEDRNGGNTILFAGPNGFMASGGGGTFVPEAREYTEEEVTIACEWGLVFMLMLKDIRHPRWALDCMETAFTFPSGSYRYTFWWAMRTMCKARGESTLNLDEFREYLKNKLTDFRDGSCRRDGPIW